MLSESRLRELVGEIQRKDIDLVAAWLVLLREVVEGLLKCELSIADVKVVIEAAKKNAAHCELPILQTIVAAIEGGGRSLKGTLRTIKQAQSLAAVFLTEETARDRLGEISRLRAALFRNRRARRKQMTD
ncbi:MAG TPA: hypothetical protein VFV34_28810 [Blastocatellia bacterium]|nr:hypothetical protein [Blastocatellia bacterium]